MLDAKGNLLKMDILKPNSYHVQIEEYKSLMSSDFSIAAGFVVESEEQKTRVSNFIDFI
jgi:hypothetical protein